MGNKARIINPECGERLRTYLKEIDMTQDALAKAINYEPPYISAIIHGKKRLTPDLAKLIAKATYDPNKLTSGKDGSTIYRNRPQQVRPEWLLCEDDAKTPWDYELSTMEQNNTLHDSQFTILKAALSAQGMQLVDFRFGMSTNDILQKKGGTLDFNKGCYFEIQTAKGDFVKKLSHSEMNTLLRQLQNYADFLVFGLLK